MNDEQILSDTGQNSEARKDSDQQERQYPFIPPLPHGTTDRPATKEYNVEPRQCAHIRK